MDALEKFIQQNREDMDCAVPDLKVWAAIDRNLSENAPAAKPAPRIKPLSYRLRAAAAVALLLLAGGIGGSYLSNQSAVADSLGDISPEYAEAEYFFNQQVKEKTAQLAAYNQMETVRPDLEQLDAVFAELAEELKNVPKGSEEQIINAMIKNYQAKVDILNRVLEKVENVDAPAKTQENEISI